MREATVPDDQMLHITKTQLLAKNVVEGPPTTSYLPRKCALTKQRLFFKPAVKLTRIIDLGGGKIHKEPHWVDPNAWLMLQIKGQPRWF